VIWVRWWGVVSDLPGGYRRICRPTAPTRTVNSPTQRFPCAFVTT